MNKKNIRRGAARGCTANAQSAARMPRKHCVRGEIYLANLEPIIGSEQGGIRPVLIIQNNTGNRNSGTTIAAPITTKRVPNRLPVHVFTFAGQTGLPQSSVILLEQIRVLDKSRITDFVGTINEIYDGRGQPRFKNKRWIKFKIQLRGAYERRSDHQIQILFMPKFSGQAVER